MELATFSFEKTGLVHLPQVEKREYSANELEEIGNELQICVVLLERSDMMSWITSDSENFRIWLNSEVGASALKEYLREFSFENILSRGKIIIAHYEHPEKLSSLVDDDASLPAFVAAFRKAYPKATAQDTEVLSKETIH